MKNKYENKETENVTWETPVSFCSDGPFHYPSSEASDDIGTKSDEYDEYTNVSSVDRT